MDRSEQICYNHQTQPIQEVQYREFNTIESIHLRQQSIQPHQLILPIHLPLNGQLEDERIRILRVQQDLAHRRGFTKLEEETDKVLLRRLELLRSSRRQRHLLHDSVLERDGTGVCSVQSHVEINCGE